MSDGAIRHASPHPPEPRNRSKCGGCRLQDELDRLREIATPLSPCNPPTKHRYSRIGVTDMLRCRLCGFERPG